MDQVATLFLDGSLNIFKHVHGVDFPLPPLGCRAGVCVCVWVHGFWLFELPALLAKEGLYIPMCHVASARRIALKVGLELCGGGGGFQAPGPGVGEGM